MDESSDNIKKFIDKVKNEINKNQIDLSSGEDLSIGVMNLVSLEEHLFFSYEKTNNPKYLEMLNQVRQMRKELLGRIVKNPQGEEWCISKHLLAGSMRFIEVGTKYLQDKKNTEAQDFFDKAYSLYSFFWAINLKAASIKDLKEKISEMTPKQNKTSDKFKQILNELMDCCEE